MGEMHPPTAADYAADMARSAKDAVDRLKEQGGPVGLRDMFAAHALVGLVGKFDVRDVGAISSQAFSIAEAMMAERKRRAK